MKKLTTLLLAAGMVFAASAPASAVDVKMDGEYMFTFGLGERVATGANFDNAGQRLRLGMTFTANENLSGYVQLQAGIAQDANNGYDWGTDVTGRNSDVAVRQAYIDWIIPSTDVKVRMGKQLTGLPIDAFGKNAIMQPTWGGRDGISLSAPVADWLDINAFWLRSAYEGVNSNDTDQSNKSDFFAVSAAMKFDGFSITPYVMYAALDDGASVPGSTDASYAGYYLDKDGKKVNNTPSADGNAFWAGVTATMTYFDPFVLKLSGAYGVVNYDGLGTLTGNYDSYLEKNPKSSHNWNDRDGWYVQAKASYKTAYGTPILGAWYGSGDDRDAQYLRQGWIPTNAGRFHPTVAYCAGEYGLYDTTTRHNIAGTWGVQAGIEDVSFLQDLSHKFTVTLWKGTNEDSSLATNTNPYEYMTTSDTAVEFNLINTYKIYKNLTTCLELSYIIADYDKDDHAVWAGGDDWSENGWSAMLSFAYKF